MKIYTVHYGHSVPWSSRSLKSWLDASKVIKQMLDADIPIRSIVKEEVIKSKLGDLQGRIIDRLNE